MIRTRLKVNLSTADNWDYNYNLLKNYLFDEDDDISWMNPRFIKRIRGSNDSFRIGRFRLDATAILVWSHQIGFDRNNRI